MSTSYNHKDEATLIWKENRERIQLAIRQLTNRMMDTVLTEVNDEFNKALHEGRMLEYTSFDQAELLRRLSTVTQRALDAG